MTSLQHAFETVHASGQTCLQNPETRETRLQALSAARKLVWELESEQGAVFNRIGDLLSTLALGFLVNIGVPQSIPQHGSIFLDELAVKVQADASFLARLMRLLCAFGIFQETDRDTYAHTKQSILYGQAEGEFVSLLINEQFLPVFSRLSEYFADRTLESPNDPKRHPYGWAHGMNDHHWIEVLARDPKNLALFAKSAGFLGDFAADVYIYPYDKELKGASDKAVTDNSVLMVDIGGSTGDTMKILRQHYSDLKGRIVVQDIPDVINNIPAGYLPDGIEATVHDFWQPQPIKGAGAYYMRRVMHDWPDEYCRNILRHIVDAMDEHSKLLIAEAVVPERVDMRDPSVYWMDLVMFTFSGKERTAVQWKDLFESAGLELVKIWSMEMNNHSVLEGRKNMAMKC
ncbi:S-adenosyl-L-methionine-dependent methyltransferase [Aureobasidium pullulans]|uniref:S-adenosyl-L-methionine-dependent methyltransferase n=1 Tax=Aureobasidium pullulans TaxID=5580 RepID=A0A4S9XLD6_AURPU|nr:S-adenosyl-L-methionine-dependent methyltransferase [Aureobasidium pullulans]